MEFDGKTDTSLRRNNDVATPKDRRVGLIFDERMCKHYAPDNEFHPECPDRIRVIWDRLNSSGLAKRCVIMNAKEAEDKHLALVHTKNHIDLIKNISSKNSESKRKRIAARFDSIHFSEGSTEAAYIAAGSVIEVAEKVAKGELESAFAIVRPPGHHAEQDEPMGFCLYNNVAVATSYLLNERSNLGIKRILIVDWDVHHGNGTQKMFYDDNRVLFFSVHRYDDGTFYPVGHDGSYIMTGDGPGAGHNINVPWESGRCGDADYLAVWDKILIPVAKEFNPDLIIISAGFDAAIGDPLGGCCITPYGYSILLDKLMEFAGGKIVMALEGGYNLKSTANSAEACVEVLLQGGHPITESLEAYPFESTWRVIQEVRQALSTYWPVLAAKLPDWEIIKTSPLEISSSDSDGEHENKQVQTIEDVIQPLMNLKVNKDSQGNSKATQPSSELLRGIDKIRQLALNLREVDKLTLDEEALFQAGPRLIDPELPIGTPVPIFDREDPTMSARDLIQKLKKRKEPEKVTDPAEHAVKVPASKKGSGLSRPESKKVTVGEVAAKGDAVPVTDKGKRIAKGELAVPPKVVREQRSDAEPPLLAASWNAWWEQYKRTVGPALDPSAEPGDHCLRGSRSGLDSPGARLQYILQLCGEGPGRRSLCGQDSELVNGPYHARPKDGRRGGEVPRTDGVTRQLHREAPGSAGRVGGPGERKSEPALSE